MIAPTGVRFDPVQLAKELVDQFSVVNGTQQTGRVIHRAGAMYVPSTGQVTLPDPSDPFPVVLSSLKVERYKDVDYPRLHGRCVVAGAHYSRFVTGDILVLEDGYHLIKNVNFDQYGAAYKLDYEKKIWHS